MAEDTASNGDEMEYKLRKQGKYVEGKTKLKVDPKQLQAGIKIEMEHTTSKKAARQIALDHLVEDPKYYTHLKGMEAKHMNKARSIYAAAHARDVARDRRRKKPRRLRPGPIYTSRTRKSLDLFLDLDKARKMPIGTVSHGYRKVADGKWRKVSTGTKKKKKTGGFGKYGKRLLALESIMFSASDLLSLQKAKKMPIGTVSHGYKKIAEGKWRKVPKGRKEGVASAEPQPKQQHVAASKTFKTYQEALTQANRAASYYKHDMAIRKVADLYGKGSFHVSHASKNDADYEKYEIVKYEPPKKAAAQPEQKLGGNYSEIARTKNPKGEITPEPGWEGHFRVDHPKMYEPHIVLGKETAEDILASLNESGGEKVDREALWNKWTQGDYFGHKAVLEGYKKNHPAEEAKQASEKYLAQEKKVLFGYLDKLDSMIDSADIESLASRLRPGQKISREYFGLKTGKKLTATTAEGTKKELGQIFGKSIGRYQMNLGKAKIALVVVPGEMEKSQKFLSQVSDKIKSPIPYTGHAERMKLAKMAAERMAPKPESAKKYQPSTVDMQGRSKVGKPKKPGTGGVSGMGSNAANNFGRRTFIVNASEIGAGKPEKASAHQVGKVGKP